MQKDRIHPIIGREGSRNFLGTRKQNFGVLIFKNKYTFLSIIKNALILPTNIR